MTPRSLFIIILKILGLLFIKNIIVTILQLVSTLLYLGRPDVMQTGIATFIYTLCILAIYVLIVYLLIFKPGQIIDKLKLGEGFTEDRLNVNISVPAILSIALICVSAFILINEIPNFFRLVFSYLHEAGLTSSSGGPKASYFIFSGVKILIALLLIGERKRIVHFMERNAWQ